MDRDKAYEMLCRRYDEYLVVVRAPHAWTMEHALDTERVKDNVITAVGDFIRAESDIDEGA